MRTPNLPDSGFAPDGPLDVYATSITAADVAAMESFLAARLDEVGARYQATAPETRIAQSLYETAGFQLDQLNDTLTPSPDRETLLERLNLWNGLVHALQPWRGTPGHDGERWRLISWTDETTAVQARRPSTQRQGTT
ncbi:hypothetical protein ACF1GX_30385 [Streptomyces albidoflavus]|uniref:hypothetical protein n=1 Tax=Streptomyces albidoflavus TaxID=1886 RepID=UPI000525BE85|nr:hypothetical protein [Streptomyces albidoflavus]RZD77128.1 hypothetical protein C0Q63_31795 [Streptomyces albidoflavus]